MDSMTQGPACDKGIPWEQWRAAQHDPRKRKLGDRRVSLPLFGGEP